MRRLLIIGEPEQRRLAAASGDATPVMTPPAPDGGETPPLLNVHA
jgi:hypothetical protein